MTRINFPSGPVRISYGAYRNKTMEDIPSGYLKWLAENADDDDIATAADEEYRRRTDEHEHWYEDMPDRSEERFWDREDD